MKSNRKRLVQISTAVLATALPAVSVYANAYTSNVTGTWSWTNSGNWTSPGLPGDGDGIRLNPAATATVNLDGSRTIGTVTIANTAGTTTIATGTPSTSSLTVQSGLTVASSPGTTTISAPLIVNASQSWAVQTYSTVNFNNVSIASGQTLTLAGTGSGTFNIGVLSGSGPININRSAYGGGVAFTGNTGYTGSVTVTKGYLQFAASSNTLPASQISITDASYATGIGTNYAINNGFLKGSVGANTGSFVVTLGFNTNSNALDFSGSNGGVALPNASLGAIGGTRTFGSATATLTPYGSTYRLGGGGSGLVMAGNLTGGKDLNVYGYLVLAPVSGTNNIGAISVTTGGLEIDTNEGIGSGTGAISLAYNTPLWLQSTSSAPLVVARDISGSTISRVYHSGGSNDVTLSGNISGSTIVTQNLANHSLTLSGNNTYTGNTQVTAGTLNLSGGTIGNSAITVDSGATFNESASGVLGSSSSLTVNGTATLLGTSNSGTISVGGGATLTFGSNALPPSGLISFVSANMTIASSDATARTFGTTSRFPQFFNFGQTSGGTGDLTINQLGTFGAGTQLWTIDCGKVVVNAVPTSNTSNTPQGFVKSGQGTLVIAAYGNNGDFFTRSGWPVTLNAGSIQLGDNSTSGQFGCSAGITVNSTTAGTTVIFSRTNALTFNAGTVFTGTLGLSQIGSGTTTLSSANSYTGGTSITGGTLTISGTGSINSTSGVTVGAGGIFDYSSSTPFTQSVTNNGGIVQGTGTINSPTAMSITGGTVAGSVSSPNGISFAGTGNIVSGNVTSGSLMTLGLNGSLNVSGTLTGSLSLGSGSTLGGSGRINGTVGGSGLFSPGNSPGIQTVTQINPTGGMDYKFELTQSLPDYTSATLSKNDVIHLTGGTPFTASLASPDNTVDVYFEVAGITSGDHFFGGFFTNDKNTDFVSSVNGGAYNYFVLGDGSGTHGGYYTLAELYGPGAHVTISTASVTAAGFATGTTDGRVTEFTVAVPEPSTVAMMLGFIGFLAIGRHRRPTGPGAGGLAIGLGWAN